MDEQDERSGFGDEHDRRDAKHARSRRGCWIAAIAAFLLGALGVMALIGGLAYIGSVSPETSIYEGQDVPADFLVTLVELGALEPDEELVYFYSDGLFDIAEGFYFVSDRKVAVYLGEAMAEDGEDLILIDFGDILSVHLERDTSFMVDSTLLLTRDDGVVIQFPLSSEQGRDEDFQQEILDRMR